MPNYDDDSEYEDYDRGDRSSRGRGGGEKEKKKYGGGAQELDYNFRPMNILVYKNGDEWDPGTIVSITRRQFRNWVALLDFLTSRLRMPSGAVHQLFSLEDSKEARHFKDIEDGGRYVAVAFGKFKKANYGIRPNPKWTSEKHVRGYDPGAIGSGESYKMYLRKKEFRPQLDDMWENSDFDLKKKPPTKEEEEQWERELSNKVNPRQAQADYDSKRRAKVKQKTGGGGRGSGSSERGSSRRSSSRKKSSKRSSSSRR